MCHLLPMSLCPLINVQRFYLAWSSTSNHLENEELLPLNGDGFIRQWSKGTLKRKQSLLQQHVLLHQCSLLSLRYCTCGVWKHALFIGVHGCKPALCAATAELQAPGSLFTTGVTKLRERTIFLMLPGRTMRSKMVALRRSELPVSAGVFVAVWGLTDWLWVQFWWRRQGRSGKWLQQTRNRSRVRRGCMFFLRI